jgi:molecular chaperone GrpE
MVPDDTEIIVEAAAPEERGVIDGDGPVPLPGNEPSAMQRKIQLLEEQLEESFKRARDTGDRLKETHERLLRTAAELDNFKKRAAREKEDVQKFGTERLLKDFLPVMDNLERALDHAGQSNIGQVVEGVKLVQKLFESTLARHGVIGFSAVGKPFDPTVHEALMNQESDAPPGTVISEMAKGYKLHDRLVRPAAVVVAKGREEDGGTGTPSA